MLGMGRVPAILIDVDAAKLVVTVLGVVAIVAVLWYFLAPVKPVPRA